MTVPKGQKKLAVKKRISSLGSHHLDWAGINACSGGGETEASSFTIKGKGGIPPVPTETFMADALVPDGKPITLDKETDLNSLLVEESETDSS